MYNHTNHCPAKTHFIVDIVDVSSKVDIFLGVCHHTSDSEFDCECREGFQGSHCQSPVPCDMRTRCLNGGTCIEPEQGSGDVVCLCPHGYLGMYHPPPPPPHI